MECCPGRHKHHTSTLYDKMVGRTYLTLKTTKIQKKNNNNKRKKKERERERERENKTIIKQVSRNERTCSVLHLSSIHWHNRRVGGMAGFPQPGRLRNPASGRSKFGCCDGYKWSTANGFRVEFPQFRLVWTGWMAGDGGYRFSRFNYG